MIIIEKFFRRLGELNGLKSNFSSKNVSMNHEKLRTFQLSCGLTKSTFLQATSLSRIRAIRLGTLTTISFFYPHLPPLPYKTTRTLVFGTAVAVAVGVVEEHIFYLFHCC